MEVTTMMEMTRPAHKGGGDRFETMPGQPFPKLVIYFPQEVSRTEGKLNKRIELTVRVVENA